MLAKTLSRARAVPLACLALCALPRGPARAQVVLSEVLFDPAGVDTGQQAIEILNQGAEPAEVGGFWLLLKPAAWQIPPQTSIPPKGTLVVHVNASGAARPGELFTGTSGMRNLRRDDSISLFSFNLFTDPTKLVDFVEWGSPGQAGEEIAVEAAQWNAADSVLVYTLREGSTIAHRGEGLSASAWCIDGSPSLGAANDGCTPSRARSPVRLNELRPGAESFVELKNSGRVIEDLEGKWLLGKGASTYRFPPGTIVLPGEILLVYAGVSGPDRPGVLHTGPQFQKLDAADSIALCSVSSGADASMIIDFLEWGSAGLAFEAQSAEAGIWTAGEAVNVAGLAPGGAVASRPEGSGLARWEVDNTPTPGQENDAAVVSSLVLNELLVSPAAGGGQWIEIHHRGAAPIDLAGFKLCTGSRGPGGNALCAPLPAGSTVGAGGFLTVRIGAAPADGEAAVELRLLDPAGDELGLLVPGPGIAAGDYLDYLRWGGGSPVLEPAAAAAGVWPAGGTVDVNGLGEGASLARLGEGRGPASFRIDVSPSPGEPNAERPPEHDFVRGDCNQDLHTDISDGIGLFNLLFMGHDRSACDDACDANDDAGLDISDPVYILGALFLGSAPPGPPSSCGPDPSVDDLPCIDYQGCP